jgi:hypothetical protein
MRENGWPLPPGDEPVITLTVIVTGDSRLPDAAYPFVCRTLDKLLRRHLPTVCLIYCWRSTGTDALVGRYVRERKLPFNLIGKRTPDVLAAMAAQAVIIFDGGAKESDALVRQASADRLAVRVVDVRRFVTPARG